MRLRSPSRTKLIGLAGCAGIALFIVVANNAKQVFRASARHYVAELTNASGLEPDVTQVKLKGLRVGTVTDVTVAEDQAEITFEVDEGVDLRSDARLFVYPKNLLGEKYLSLEPGQAGDPLGPRIAIGATHVTSGLSEALAGTRKPAEAAAPEDLVRAQDTMSEAISREAPALSDAVSRMARITDSLAGNPDAALEVVDDADIVLAGLASNRATLSAVVADLKHSAAVVGESLDENLIAASGIYADLVSLRAQFQAHASELKRALSEVPLVLDVARAIVNKLAANLENGDYPLPVGLDNFGPVLMGDHDAQGGG